jgi:cytochrome P450
MTTLLAGEDTTSHTLAWATSLLAEHPDAQAWLAGDAAATLATAPVAPDHETADRLAFADGVVRETLRIRPVALLKFIEAVGPSGCRPSSAIRSH